MADEFLTNRAVRKISFTGSTEVGKQIARRAADQLKRVSLELGGHAPFIVLHDADPVHAARGAALVKFLNTGQACICPNRLFVHRLDSRPLRGRTVRPGRQAPGGNGLDDGVTVGPLIDEAAVDKMERQVADAAGKGAIGRCSAGIAWRGSVRGGCFYAPTVLTGRDTRNDIYREETFGPIAPVMVFEDEDEVIEMANDTTYGLASYVYTNDLRRAMTVAEGLDFGMIGINDINPTSASVPFGGIKESGVGREGAREGLLEYLDQKVVGIAL